LISGSILRAKFSTTLGSVFSNVGILFRRAYFLFSMGIVAPQSNSTRITLSFSLFFKIILMTCLLPLFGSGRFGQLGLAATTELLGKTGDGSILCRLFFIQMFQLLVHLPGFVSNFSPNLSVHV
jgi:hypothetical protein